jgi:hypothetical protein
LSREIEGNLEDLSTEDLEYMRARGQLTPEQERDLLGDSVPPTPTAPSLDDTPYVGDENTAPSVVTNDGGSTLGPDDYEDASNDRLKEELRRRGLSTSGNKAELIERLEENDQESAE